MSSKQEVKKPYVGVAISADLMKRLLAYKKEKEKQLGLDLSLSQILRSIIEKEV